MTVREFLLRVRKQNHMLLVYEQELTNLQAHASNISSPAFGDKVQGNHISSLDEIVEKIVMQADKVNQLWDAYIANKERAASMIGRIDDDAQKAGAMERLFEELIAIPVMVIHDHFAALMKKDGREERFAEMCLELYDTVEKGFVTPAELRQCLFEEAGVRFKHPSDSLPSERKEATKV